MSQPRFLPLGRWKATSWRRGRPTRTVSFQLACRSGYGGYLTRCADGWRL